MDVVGSVFVICVLQLLFASTSVSTSVTDGISTSASVIDLSHLNIATMDNVSLTNFTNIRTLVLTNNMLEEFPDFPSLYGNISDMIIGYQI